MQGLRTEMDSRERRLRTTWRRTVPEMTRSAGISSEGVSRLAQDRANWRDLVEALCATKAFLRMCMYVYVKHEDILSILTCRSVSLQWRTPCEPCVSMAGSGNR